MTNTSVYGSLGNTVSQPESGTITISAGDTDERTRYFAIIEGTVTPKSSGGRGDFDRNDVVIRWLDDQVALVAGGVALQGSDTFDFSGPIRRFETFGPPVTIELNGQVVSEGELTTPISGSECDHYCGPAEPECSTDADCPEGQVCINGACREPQGGGGDDFPWGLFLLAAAAAFVLTVAISRSGDNNG